VKKKNYFVGTMPPIFHKSILFLHIACGIVVLLGGLLQIVLTKGTRFHRYNGKVYFWSITGVIFTGCFLAPLIIVFIGLFGYYYALTGYRYAVLKNGTHTIYDKIIILCGLFISVAMLIEGLECLLGSNITQGIILSLFGLLFITNVIPDVLRYVLYTNAKPNKHGRRNWLFEHFGRMYISYIMALTAFAVINNIFHVLILNWVLPTIIGTALISITKQFYVKRFAKTGTATPEQIAIIQTQNYNEY
jgi:uncharacterized membrane protein